MTVKKEQHAHGIRFFILMIQTYQRILSPIKWIFFQGLRVRCVFTPSCSEYACESLRQYGLLKGIIASVRRIVRCNPWSKGGYDPV